MSIVFFLDSTLSFFSIFPFSLIFPLLVLLLLILLLLLLSFLCLFVLPTPESTDLSLLLSSSFLLHPLSVLESPSTCSSILFKLIMTYSKEKKNFTKNSYNKAY
ncbi:hypothetical protein CsatB_018940 [Cannabis sativa]